MTPTCRRCGEPIMFALTDKNKRMPIDPVPDPAGNVYVRWEGGKMYCTVVSAEHPHPEGVAHLPHFATCARRKNPQ